MAHSPYLTAPLEQYSPESIRMGPQLMKIRFEGKMKGAKIRKKDFPCNLKQAKKVWKKEVDEYQEHLNKSPPFKKTNSAQKSKM